MSEKPKFVKSVFSKPSPLEGVLREVPHVTSLDKATRREIIGVIMGQPVEEEPKEDEEDDTSKTE